MGVWLCVFLVGVAVLWWVWRKAGSGRQRAQLSGLHDKLADPDAFPQGFLWGVADSAHQVEGGCNGKHCNWTRFVERQNLRPCGIACDRRKHLFADVASLHDLGVGIYRFSIEWSRVQPHDPESFDQEGFRYYEQLVEALDKRGIQTMATLHHHTLPVWFEDLGGFEHKRNGVHFLRFCKWVFRRLHQKVRFWATFNEPAGYTIQAYARGVYPPARKDWKLTAKVLKNVLFLHVRLYKALKSIDPECQIGIIHMYVPLRSFSGWNPAEFFVSSKFGWLQNQLLVHFFLTGAYRFSFFTWAVEKRCAEATRSLDFFGLNYYTTMFLKFTLFSGSYVPFVARSCRNVNEEALQGENHWGQHPGGLQEAIASAQTLPVPIIITENGFSESALDDYGRIRYLQDHLAVLVSAIEKGTNIIGYIYWSFMDNFEWREGYAVKFGLYQVDFESEDQKRTLRASGEMYRKLITATQVKNL